MGAGVARWLAVLLSFSRLSPAPMSGNSILETCSGVLVPYTRQIGRGTQQWPALVGKGLLFLQVWALSQSSVGLVHSEGPHSHRVEEGQVLSSFDGQLSGGIVVDDFWDTVERGAVLTQNILLFGFGQFHVHKALVALQREGIVVLAGLAVPDKVAALLAEPQKVLSISSADGSVIPDLLFQRDSRIHSFSQDPTELRAPMLNGLKAPSRSSKLAPPVPGR